MSDINWLNNAVCHAKGKQWFAHTSSSLMDGDKYSHAARSIPFDWLVKQSDFQLNEIREGDFIPASELDTEQKYNDVVEVFGLFGVNFSGSATHEYYAFKDDESLTCCSDGLWQTNSDRWNKRQLTYHQIIAIGKLKRMMLEREKSAPEKTTDFTKVSSNKYEREITDRQGNSATVDVYDVLKAFEVTCPATQHAVKKLLCSGLRGHKDLQTDLIEAKESIVRAIELN